MQPRIKRISTILSLLFLLNVSVLNQNSLHASSDNGGTSSVPMNSMLRYNTLALGASLSFAGLLSYLFFEQIQGVVKTIRQNFVAPFIEGNVNKHLPPYFWLNTPALVPNDDRVSDLILDPETERKVNGYIVNLKRAARLKKPIPKLMLYGPTGNGKTALAKRLINEIHKEGFIMKKFNGQNLAPKHQITLNNFFRWLSLPHYTWKDTLISWSPYMSFAASLPFAYYWIKNPKAISRAPDRAMGGTVFGLLTLGTGLWSYSKSDYDLERILIVIDESEALFKGSAYQREHNPAVTAFLVHTGEDSRFFSVIATTNYIKDIDEAAESRLNPSIKLGNPGPVERRKILAQYLSRYFAPGNVEDRFDSDLLSEIFATCQDTCRDETKDHSGNQSREDPLSEEDEVLPDDSIIAMSDGLSGRDLQKISEQSCAEALYLNGASELFLDGKPLPAHVKVTKKNIVDNIINLKKGRQERLASMKEGLEERRQRQRERYQHSLFEANKNFDSKNKP